MPDTCRRCSECEGMSHHWLPNPDYCNDEAPEELQYAGWICKHCNAVGDDCGSCYGIGITEDEEDCHDCEGEGVIEIRT